MKNKGVMWWLTTIVLPGLMLTAAIGIPIALADRMPDPVARHWGLTGEPNGASSLWVLTGVIATIMVLTWGALVAADRRGTSSKSLVSVVYFLQGLLVGTMVSTSVANLDATSWEQAAEVGLLQVILTVVVGLMAGAAGWFLGEEEQIVGAKAPAGAVLSVGLSEGASAVWLGKAESRFMPAASGVLFIAAIVTGGVAALVLVVVSALVLFMSAARVSVNEKGVSIGGGWWGWPHRLIPLEEISHADVLTVEPMAHGGWGLRGKGTGKDKSWALIVRRGPGLRLMRPNASNIIVTVDDPEQGAGLINDLLVRSGGLDATARPHVGQKDHSAPDGDGD